jgi:hypothetical protein
VLTQDLKNAEAGTLGTPLASRSQTGASPLSRSLLACGFTFALLLGSFGGAQASAHRKETKKETKKEPIAAPKGPLTISVSIAHQHVTVYDDGVAIAHAPVSTGMAGHATPTGVFSVIQKQKWHQSNIYSGAPMPFMQRITWSGVALHAGVLPGYPASHGCIRMPSEFAVRLYGMTKMGARVFVTRDDVTPVPFTDPHLFTPRRPEPDVSAAESSSDASDHKSNDLLIPVKATAPAPAEQASKPPSPGAEPPPTKLADTASQVPTAEKPTADASKAVDGSPGGAKADDNSKADAKADDAARSASDKSKSDGAAHSDAQVDKSVTAQSSAESAQAAPPASTEQSPAAPSSAVPSSAVPSSAAPSSAQASPTPAASPSTDSSVAAAPDSGQKGDEPPAFVDVPLPQSRPQIAEAKPGPISIFISKKLGRLYVRKGFDAIFDSPVTIADPERPLGTQVFTATGFTDDHSAMHWLLVSLPAEASRKPERRAEANTHRRHEEPKVMSDAVETSSAEAAASALARVDVPPDVRERIADLLVPGSSLIISDKDLGPETGASGETDFIVLTH